MDSNDLVRNHQHVQILSRLLGGAESTLETVPQLIVKIVDNNMWQDRVITETGERVQFDRFEEFAETKPLEGLGVSLKMLKRVCKDNPAALDAIDRATARGPGRPSSDDKNHNNVMNSSQGNTSEYALRKLRKDAPELHEEVVQGKVSPHAAMVRAGFRDRKLQYYPDDPERTAALLKKNMTQEDIETLTELLNE